MSKVDKETIKSILEHKIYTTILSGEERFRGILGELFEEGIFEDENKIKITPFQELKTVEDVEKLIESLKEATDE